MAVIRQARFGIDIDGYVQHGSNAIGDNDTWSNMVTGNGDIDNNGSTFFGVYASADSSTDRYDIIRRGVCNFDTTDLRSGATVTEAWVRLYVDNALSSLGDLSLGIYEANPAGGTLVPSDYQNAFGTTRLDSSTHVTTAYCEDNVNGWVTFKLNASGIALITAGGTTNLGIRLVADADNDETELSWANGVNSFVTFASSEDTVAAEQPELIVAYEVEEDYATLVLSDGPVAYWKLDETSGTTAADSTVNGYDATYINTPSLNDTNVVPSVSDASAKFADASTERVQLPSGFLTAVETDTTGSIELWFLGDDINHRDPLFCISSGTAGDRLIVQDSEVYDAVRCVVRDNNTNLWGRYANGHKTKDLLIHHVVVTQDGTEGKIYVDGTEWAYSGSSGSEWLNDIAAIDDGHIGYEPNSGGSMSGTIGHVAYYDYALNANEVADHYIVGQAYGYAKAVINHAPWAYFRANDSENRGDDAINLADPSYSGSWVGSPPDISGLLTNDSDLAADFQFNDSLDLADPERRLRFTVEEPYTVGCWFQADSLASSYYPLLVRDEGFGDRSTRFRLNSNSGYKVLFEHMASTTVGSAEGTTSISTGTAYFAVGVWDGTNMTVYLDGQKDNTSDTAPVGDTDQTTAKTEIGAWDTIPRTINAKIDEIMVIPKALTAGEVEILYDTGKDQLGIEVLAGTTSAQWSTNPATIQLNRSVSADAGALGISPLQASIQFDKSVTADAGALGISSLSAIIGLDIAVPAFTAGLGVTPYAAGVVADVDVDAVAASLGVSSEVAEIILSKQISALTAALGISPNAAGVTADVDVSAALGALGLSSNPASVVWEAIVRMVAGNLGIESHRATIGLDLDFVMDVGALGLTLYNPQVNAQSQISAFDAALALSTLGADVNLDKLVDAVAASLGLSTLGADVDLDKPVSALTAALGVSPIAANVNAETNLTTGSAGLNISTHNAVVQLVLPYDPRTGEPSHSYHGFGFGGF